MYSLGLVLYELYHPFNTESERYFCLEDVRRGRVDDKFKQQWMQEVLCRICTIHLLNILKFISELYVYENVMKLVVLATSV